jgi:hypothetical protein
VPDHHAVEFGDQRQCQSACSPERIDDQMLRLLAERVVPERRHDDVPNGLEVALGLSADDHEAAPLGCGERCR